MFVDPDIARSEAFVVSIHSTIEIVLIRGQELLAECVILKTNK
jgi:hypothetical protein